MNGAMRTKLGCNRLPTQFPSGFFIMGLRGDVAPPGALCKERTDTRRAP
jgi:hypothetical protein